MTKCRAGFATAMHSTNRERHFTKTDTIVGDFLDSIGTEGFLYKSFWS